MHISFEGRIGSGLGLLGLLGAGVSVIAPAQAWLGWALIAVAVVGGIFLAAHHVLGVGIKDRQSGHARKMIAVYGMAFCAVGFLGSAALYFWPVQSLDRPTSNTSAPASRPVEGKSIPAHRSPMFDLSDGAEATVGELHSTGDPVGVANVRGKSKIIIGRANIVGPNSPPFEIAAPSPEFANLSNAQLLECIKAMVSRLREFQINIDTFDRTISNEIFDMPGDLENRSERISKLLDTRLKASEQNEIKFNKEFSFVVLQLISASVERIGPIQISQPVITDGPNNYMKRRSIMSGMSTVRTGIVMNQPVNVANFLDYVAEMIPP